MQIGEMSAVYPAFLITFSLLKWPWRFVRCAWSIIAFFSPCIYLGEDHRWVPVWDRSLTLLASTTADSRPHL
ncbi:hypothetical protein VTN00DRAFT_655 [Thermoascus crustaceus]|uniref:uncharacterized protein n=1 Tax=Thermoascus crustaceus TaxID=5088 RepID=UPI0037420FC4